MKEILHFSAEWCGPCKMMVPVIGKFLESNPDIKYTKIDIDKQPELSEAYAIKGVPTFIGLENGDIVNRVMGAVPLAKIEGIFKDND